MYLDMGYEKYERRREMRKRGCRIHMEHRNVSLKRKD